MNKKINFQKILVLIVLALLVLSACKPKTDTKDANIDSVPTNTESVAAVENSVIIDASLLDDVIEVPEGGFSFRPAKGYQLQIDGGEVMMLAPGGDPDVGPVIQIMGMFSEMKISTDELYEQLQSGIDMEVGPAKEIALDGEEGLLVEVTRGEGSVATQGQLLLFVIDDHQELVLLAGSSRDDWEGFIPVVESVIASIKFTELEAAVMTSNLASGSYKYTNRNVIRDLVEKDGVIYAATLGGLTAWNMNDSNAPQSLPTEGMGHSSANAITYCEIPEPRILVGTLSGITIYDPATGQWDATQLLPEGDYVNSSKISRLFCDQANNRLLIGYSGLGVLDLSNGDYKQYTEEDGFLWTSITDITVKGSDIWVATGYKGIARISNGVVTTFTEAEGMPDEGANALQFGKDGTLWIGASDGLISYQNSTWKLYGTDSPSKLHSINEIEPGPGNTLWVGTAPFGSGRLCLFNPTTGACDEDFTDQDNSYILALTTNTNLEPIYGSERGITVYSAGELNPLKTDDQLATNYVDSLAVAPDGMLWVGTDGGVQIVDPANPDKPWTTYKQNDQNGMGGNWASSIAFSSDGTAWLTMINGDASRYQKGSWQTLDDIYSFDAVAVDSQDRTWLADNYNGVVVLDKDGNQMMTFTTENGLPSNEAQSLVVDKNGTVWIGTSQGLVKYENNELSVVITKDNSEIPDFYLRALALDQNGNLLIGTYTGVASFDGQKAEMLINFYDEGFDYARLTVLSCDTKGELWIGTDKGLLHGNPSKSWSIMTTNDGLLTNYISALIVDQYDSIWVGGGGSNFDGGGLLHIVP